MDKEEVLQSVRALAASGSLTKEELLGVYEDAAKSGGLSPAHKLGVATILYYAGGAIIFLGIVFLVQQNWTLLSPFTRILVTLGSAIAAYVTGVLLGLDKRSEAVGRVFHLIAALILPAGLYVVFGNAGFDTGSSGTMTLISGMLFAVYLVSFLFDRRVFFLLFEIVFGTWFFFAVTGALMDQNRALDTSAFLEYRFLLTGLAYLFLGYGFRLSRWKPLTGSLYGFGLLMSLGAALALGGWSPNQNSFWEIIFPVLVFGTLFASVYLRSKAFLVFGGIFLMAYISKITAEYFSDSLGWPLALVIAGLLLIGTGYLTVYLNRKYIKQGMAHGE